MFLHSAHALASRGATARDHSSAFARGLSVVGEFFARSERAYQIFEIELTRPLPELRVAPQYSGVAFVVRRRERPIGFFMQAMPGGTPISGTELSRALLRNLGPRILEESLFEELVTSLDYSAFPSLTIAVCTRNRPVELARCIESLRKMRDGYPELAGRIGILIIDNAPSDEATAALVARFPEVQYVVEKKPGLDFARNRAIQEATGELLAYVDDDAVVDHAWLEGLAQAWAVNPDAAAFTGPVLPYELETRAQVAFEELGGFGSNFQRTRFGREQADSSCYPCGAGVFGCGCNMVFRRCALIELGGFDDALDTGAPLPGGGDLDMFYRVVRAGYPLISEPKLLVFHQHRREYARLRHQMWTWGLGSMAYINKTWHSDPSERANICRWVWWWLAYQISKIVVPFARKSRKTWPLDLVLAEIAGGAAGLMGEYRRSLKRIEQRRRLYS
jgi:GT2 family glycosyltransferase